MALMLITSAEASYWSATVRTNTTSWHIYRQSETMAFNFSGSFEGRISPVEYHGNTINSHYSSYVEIIANDVRLSERTSAYDGKIQSDSNINLESSDEKDINITIDKPSDIATIEHSEQWPVRIVTGGRLEYFGREINSRRFEGNSGDYIKANFFYSPELIDQWETIFILERMNATVKATNDNIISADFMPTRYLGNKMDAHTTGIADLSYKLSSPHYDFRVKQYPALAQSDERYYGSFNISRLVETRSLFNENDTSDEYDMFEDAIKTGDTSSSRCTIRRGCIQLLDTDPQNSSRRRLL